MGLRDVLEKMKLVEAVQEAGAVPTPSAAKAGDGKATTAAAAKPAPKPGKGATGADSIEELLRSLPPMELDEKALPPRPPVASRPVATRAAGSAATDVAPGHEEALDDEPSFADIYKAARITDPAHGFSAYKVLEILGSDAFAGLDTKARAAALVGFLRMNPQGPVAIQDVIQDALRRDQALDAYEDLKRRRADAEAKRVDEENAALQAEIDELARRNREKMDENRRRLEVERSGLAVWQTRKRLEERKLFDAVAPFIEENPVSLGDVRNRS